MECAECKVRSSVAFCHECEMLLCEVCSHTCERCDKIVCRSHIQRTSSGRNICVSCVVHHYDKRARQSKERRERRAEQVAMGGKVRKQKKPAAENLSFEALAQDMPTPAATYPVEDREPFEPSPASDRDHLNARVLTGSAGRRTPVWISGLAMGGVAWVLCIAALGGDAVNMQRAIFIFLAFVVSLGTVVWTASSAFSKTRDGNRRWARIAFAVGSGALLVSGGIYIMRGMGMG